MSATRRQRGYRPRDDAFTLVTLMIFVAVLNVMVAVALPLWSQQIQREKEEELIFRGLQYAEAIRLFQTRVGRYPLRLDELLEIQPRSIRQLWKDPMSEDGEWGLVFGQTGQVAQPGLGDDQDGDEDAGEEDSGGRSSSRLSSSRNRRGSGEIVATGPITGVRSLSEESAIKVFMGGSKYSEWLFSPEIIPITPTAPGEIVPSLNSKWIGRPFPEGLEPQGGAGLDDEFGDEEDEEGDDLGDELTERQRERQERRERKRDGG